MHNHIVQAVMLVILSSVHLCCLVTSNCSRCYLNSIAPIVLSPLHEILYYYQTWCFLGLRGANYNDWIRIHGEQSYCLIRTYISAGRILAKLNIGCVKIQTYNFFFTVHFWESSFLSCLLSVGLYMQASIY